MASEGGGVVKTVTIRTDIKLDPAITTHTLTAGQGWAITVNGVVIAEDAVPDGKVQTLRFDLIGTEVAAT